MMRKVNWGVIGTAGIAKGQTIPGMVLAENCSLYAIAGRDIKKAEEYRKLFGFEKAYGNYDELLEDPAVEAVYIALPNTLHCEWVKKAVSHGKHVLCEKPIAPTAQEAEELFSLAEEKGVHLMEAFAYLHSPWAAAIFSPEGIDVLTTAVFSYKDGVKAMMNCGMILATNADKRIDQLRIEGTGGSITSTGEFNGCGEMSYIITRDGMAEEKTVKVPQNYSLEVTQLGRCIKDGEKPHVSKEFTIRNLTTVGRILKEIGY